MPRRATFTTTIAAATLLAVTSAADGAGALPECVPNALRPFSTEKIGRECASDAGFSSPFALLRAPPTDAQLLAICKSRACDTLFNERVQSNEREDECIVPMGKRIRLHADLVTHVRRRCTNLKDAYVLMDCGVIDTSGGQRSEFWYFADSSNMSSAPDDDHRYTIDGNTRAQWEGDEVTVTSKGGWEIFAYIDDTGASEPVGHHAGIMEAGRGNGLNTAYECSRADDWTYPSSGGSRCERRYICFSEY
ncbi:hypothetical protein Gpo141_00011102 [Globisporangium polare]